MLVRPRVGCALQSDAGMIVASVLARYQITTFHLHMLTVNVDCSWALKFSQWQARVAAEMAAL